MNKLKLIPSFLLLALSISFLLIGVYSVLPGKNNAVGVININSTNLPVEITVYNGSVSEQNKIAQVNSVSGKQLILDGPFMFDTSSASDVEDVEPINLIVKIENLSSSHALGAYFYNQGQSLTTETDSNGIEHNVATANCISVAKTFYNSQDSAAALSATMSPYSYIAPKNNANSYDNFVYMNIEISLLKFYLTDTPIVIDFDLNIEPYISNLSDVANVSSAGELIKVSENLVSSGTQTTSIPANFYSSSTKYVVLPSGITSVDSDAFANSETILGVFYPSTLQTIAVSSNASSVQLNSSNLINCSGITIDAQSCNTLESVDLSGTKVETVNFANCSSLETINLSCSSVTELVDKTA